jgi:hypothetical protein
MIYGKSLGQKQKRNMRKGSYQKKGIKFGNKAITLMLEIGDI